MISPYPISSIPTFLHYFLQSSKQGVPKYWYRLLPYIFKDILFLPIAIIEDQKYSAQIKDLSLTADPIFILGHWRSGTSFLHNLLLQQHDFGYQNSYKKALPREFLLTEKFGSKIVQAMAVKLNVRLETQRREWDNNAPSEEEVAFLSMGLKHSTMWLHAFPKAYEQIKNYFELDDIPIAELWQWKQSYSFWIKKLAFANGNKTMMMKNPSNTARIPHLLELYPNAKFIYVHRNPLEVYLSTVRFWQISQKKFAVEKISSREITEKILGIYKIMISSYENNRSLIPANNLTEIYYEELIKSPEDIYFDIRSFLEQEDNDNTRIEVRKFIASEAKHVKEAHAFASIGKEIKDILFSFKINERYL